MLTLTPVLGTHAHAAPAQVTSRLWQRCLDWLLARRAQLHPFEQPDPAVAKARLAHLAHLALICDARPRGQAPRAADALAPLVDLIEDVCRHPDLLPTLHEQPLLLEDVLIMCRALGRLGRPGLPDRWQIQAQLDYGQLLQTERPAYSRLLLSALLDDLAFRHHLPAPGAIAQQTTAAARPHIIFLRGSDMWNLYRSAIGGAIVREGRRPLPADIERGLAETALLLLKMALRSDDATQVLVPLATAALCGPLPADVAMAAWRRLEPLGAEADPAAGAPGGTDQPPEHAMHCRLTILHAISRTDYERSAPC